MLNAIPLYKMRYSIEPRDRIYVKGYGFMPFARSMSNKFEKKLVDTAKKPTTDAIKPASKRAIQKTAEATGDLIGNKIADKITSISSNKKKSDNNSNSNNNNNNNNNNVKLTTPKKKIHITRRKRTSY